MAGATRFLYGVALGISLGIIGSKVLGAVSSGHGATVHKRPREALKVEPREKREAAAR